MAEPPEIRIADDDREAVVARLREAFSQGRLDLHELEERIATVYQAKVRSDLVAVERDLPGAPSATTTSDRNVIDRVIRAGMAPFIVAPVICTLIYLLTIPGGYFWPVWVYLGCGTVITLAVLGHKASH